VEFHREVFWDLYYLHCLLMILLIILKILSQLNSLLTTQNYMW